MNRQLPDLMVEDHGSILLLRGLTEFGREWLDEHVAFEQHFGGAGVVEPRYIGDIVEGAIDEGLRVSRT